MRNKLEGLPVIDLRKCDSYTFKAAREVRDTGVSVEIALIRAIDARLITGQSPSAMRAREEARVIETLARQNTFTIESIEEMLSRR